MPSRGTVQVISTPPAPSRAQNQPTPAPGPESLRLLVASAGGAPEQCRAGADDVGGPSRRQRRLLTHPPRRPFPQSAAARVPGSGAARAPCRHHALPHTGPLATRRNLNSLDAARLHQLSSLRRAICFRLCERELQVCDPPRWGTPHQQHEKEWLPFPQGLQLAQPPPPPARRGWPTPRRPARVNTTESWWSVAAPAGLQWPARSERAFRARLASLSRAVPTGTSRCGPLSAVGRSPCPRAAVRWQASCRTAPSGSRQRLRVSTRTPTRSRFPTGALCPTTFWLWLRALTRSGTRSRASRRRSQRTTASAPTTAPPLSRTPGRTSKPSSAATPSSRSPAPPSSAPGLPRRSCTSHRSTLPSTVAP
mmetsp:Transcript_4776/g.20432  ORF Transcript_4776/g.20432 Transcript_4776/m.20432 type:complete len:365 (+) Transcript_4776:1234-2328(+)